MILGYRMDENGTKRKREKNLNPLRVGFILDKVDLGQVFVQVRCFLYHSYSFTDLSPMVCDVTS